MVFLFSLPFNKYLLSTYYISGTTGLQTKNSNPPQKLRFKYEREARERSMWEVLWKSHERVWERGVGRYFGEKDEKEGFSGRGTLSWKSAEELTLRKVGKRLTENIPACVVSERVALEEQEVPCGWNNCEGHTRDGQGLVHVGIWRPQQ